METITVHTTQNIDIDYEIGGIGERLLATLIDMSIFVALSIVGGILAIKVLGDTGIGIYFIILGISVLFYDLICEAFFNGQSVGKKAMKIKVISLDGSRPKFSQYLLRWLFRLIDCSPTSYLVGTVAIIITDKGQRVGDIVAGTAVVRTVARTNRNDITFADVDNTYVPVFTQVSQLADKDIVLIHDVIDNYVKTGNNEIVYNLAERIKAHLMITPPQHMNSMQFLQTIIKDYSHITAQADIS